MYTLSPPPELATQPYQTALWSAHCGQRARDACLVAQEFESWEATLGYPKRGLAGRFHWGAARSDDIPKYV